MIDKLLTEEEVRKEYREQRKNKIFAQCWIANNDSFYGGSFSILRLQTYNQEKEKWQLKDSKTTTKLERCIFR